MAEPDGVAGTNHGVSYVVFGGNNHQPVFLPNVVTRGFRINGVDMGDQSGTSVSGAGDVNGDGHGGYPHRCPDGGAEWGCCG